MDGKDSFIAWLLKDLAADGFGAWFIKNLDTLGICFLFGFGMTAIAGFQKKSDGRTVLYGMAATFLLIGTLIWVADDYGVRKVFWPLISLAVGAASLMITGAWIRFTVRVEQKLPDVASDALLNRVKSAIDPAGTDVAGDALKTRLNDAVSDHPASKG